jgi:alkanesulfonate monooxygenase SsuD/methylene tetrahydromethanopterin reductase-like flavin-dependent oxidoreductase (luciferase family)
MKVGVYLRLRNPARWWRPPVDLYERGLALAEMIEELGYDSVWLTEHHFVDDGYTPSLMPLAAAVAARTRRVLIGTNVLLAPFHHPVRLAEDTAMVDIISNGRLVLGVGSGYRAWEFAGYGIDREARGSLTDEVLSVLLRCWTEEHFDHTGAHFRLRDVACTPRPIQQPHPTLYLGGLNRRALRRFARTPSAEGVAGVPPAELHAYLVEEMASAGRDPAAIRYIALLWVYVGDGDSTAWREAGEHAQYEHDTYRRWWSEVGRDVMRAPTQEHYIVGGAASCIERIHRALDHSPGEISHLVLGMDFAGLDPELLEASLRRCAADVLPHLRD